VKPEDLPDDHPVRAIPQPQLPDGASGAFDFIGDRVTARGFFRAYDQSGTLVWFYGPVDHLVVRHMAASLLDNADELELADRERERRARLN
jgi:hypothetical protein